MYIDGNAIRPGLHPKVEIEEEKKENCIMFDKAEISKLKAELENMKAEYQKTVISHLRTVFKQFFDKHKNVDSIRWRQYTPFFADGDPCEFSVGDIFLKFVDKEEDEDTDYGDGYASGNYLEGELSDDFKSLRDLVYSASDELQVALGDHLKVTVNVDGILTERYDDHG